MILYYQKREISSRPIYINKFPGEVAFLAAIVSELSAIIHAGMPNSVYPSPGGIGMDARNTRRQHWPLKCPQRQFSHVGPQLPSIRREPGLLIAAPVISYSYQPAVWHYRRWQAGWGAASRLLPSQIDGHRATLGPPAMRRMNIMNAKDSRGW